MPRHSDRRSPGIKRAITDMLTAAGAIRYGDLDPLTGTAILTCVLATEVYAEDEQGGQDWWWGRWRPFGPVAPSEELELLRRADTAEHHYLPVPDVRDAITDLLVRERGLRTRQIIRAAAVVTHLEWQGRTDTRTDVWWPAGPVPSLLSRGLLRRVLDAARKDQMAS